MSVTLPEPTIYHGLCDASAVTRIGDHIIVATDETNDDGHNVLWLYRLGEPDGEAIDLTPALGRKQAEADLEGVARIGRRLYWIGSHGANAKGKPKPARRVLLAVDIDDSGERPSVTVVPTVYRELLEDLDADPRYRKFGLLAAASRAPETNQGLSIEGLAAGGGGLLIGLRGPLFDERALVIPLLNPDAALAGEAGRFGEPVLLDLRRRGIRSLDERPDGRIAIVAGDPGSARRFKLFDWDGTTVTPNHKIDLGKCRPEGLSVDSDGGLMFVSDDGDERVGGKTMKELPDAQKRFRLFHLPPAAQSAGTGASTTIGGAPSA